jgi:hypothetical protein
MGREMLSALLASLFLIEPALDARASQSQLPQAATSEKTTLQEKVLEIPAGTLVEVRLKNKEKLRGRLGEVHEGGFHMTVAAHHKLRWQEINLDELKSIKQAKGSGGAGHVIGHVARDTGTVIGQGLLCLIFPACFGD